MDNPLTPKKIQRLMNLAEDKSFNLSRRCLLNDDDLKRLTSSQATLSKTPTNHEASSGILDLDRVEGFGDSEIDNISLSKSTAFNPGEMTGRSTGADEVQPLVDLGSTRTFEDLGRHSLAMDSITSQMDKQTSEIHDIMRHSIASNYSFHSKRDLTADEVSWMLREAPLPVHPSTQTNFADSISMNNSNMSVGAYFKNRCPEFGRMLGKTDSPDRSQRPSISEVSSSTALEYANKEPNVLKMDQSLDSVPVKQPRIPVDEAPGNLIISNLSTIRERQSNCEAVAAKQEAPSGRSMTAIDNPSIKIDHKYGSSSNLNSVMSSQKTFMHPSSSKPTDVLLRNLQSSLRMITEDTDCSVENSLSISKIADYLGKQSNVSVTDMLQFGNPKRAMKKQPLTELSMNLQERDSQEVQVATLKDSKKYPTASSAGSMNTVISFDKLKISQDEHNEVPSILVTEHTIASEAPNEEIKTKRNTRSKSPSSRSHSTLSTVQENFTSFKSGDSPLHNSRGEARPSQVPSPNIEYKELDKSIDWHDVLLQKRMKNEGLAKEQWAEIVSTPANGFVGVSCPVTVTVTTLTDSWLTAEFQFDDLLENGQNLTVELPRFPVLLSPGKSEKFTLHLTSSVEMNTSLPFTMRFKDASIDRDVEQSGTIDIKVKIPAIQAISCDGVNKLCFPPIPEKSYLSKSFVLVSDCPADLQLELSIIEGESMFFINNVQEMKKSDVNRVLMELQGSTEEQSGKGKNKVKSKQLCRLSGGNAIKVTISFNSPKFSDLEISDALASFTGALNVNLFGVKTILRKVVLVGIVGSVNLVINVINNNPGNKLALTQEPTNITVTNAGSIPGIWVVKFKQTPGENNFPFKITPAKFEVRQGRTKTISMAYTGSDDSVFETTLIFEEITTGAKSTIDIIGGSDKPKTFPIKTNYNSLSWVRPGRKEISLKNSLNKKIHLKCVIVGDGFSIDLPGDTRGTYLLPFGPCECRNLPIIYTPNSNTPQAATLHLVFDKTSDVTRSVKLYGCSSGDGLRWSGLVTYGVTALVRAVFHSPIDLTLFNKARSPAFVCARVQFNLQYMAAAESAQLVGGARVVAARGRHALRLRVDWARVERRARGPGAGAALATVRLLTGAEYTRRRILRVLRDETTGELDTSLLPDHLKMLADQLEGEDGSMDEHLADFKETKACLPELLSGLQELAAQIDLLQDFADDNTIVIADDTVVEHHTLCD